MPIEVEEELEAASAELEQELAGVPQYEPRGEVLAEVRRESRMLRIARLDHPVTPRVEISLWARLDSGLYAPIPRANFAFKLYELPSVGLAFAKAIRGAACTVRRVADSEREKQRRRAEAEPHLRAASEARAEADREAAPGAVA